MGLTGRAGAQALGTSELQTLFNSVNAMCGIGLLATPFALAEMGWLALVLMLGDSRAHILGIRDGVQLPACSRLQEGLRSVAKVVWLVDACSVLCTLSCVQQAEAAAAEEGPCSWACFASPACLGEHG